MSNKHDLSYALTVGAVLVLAATACGPTIQTGLADAQLTMRVKTALVNDSEIGTQPIDVDVRNGVVQLTGRVSTREQAVRAERVARNVDGVRDVTTALDVGPPEVVGRDQPGRLPSIAPLESDEPLRLVALGVSATFSKTPGVELGDGVAVGPIVRLRPRNGWGPSVGFGWTRTRLDQSPESLPGLADLIVRPVMGGVEYGVTRGRLATGLSLVGGYAFNSLAIDPARVGPVRAIAVDNGLALRVGASVWYDLSPRVGLNLFTGYRFARPRVTFAGSDEVSVDRVDADAVMVTVGVAYWLF